MSGEDEIMATKTVTERFDDVADAQQRYEGFVRYGRVFASTLRNDSVYDVDVVPVEALKDPNFIFIHQWWGVDRDVVVAEVQKYNSHIRRNRRCVTAEKLFMAISAAITAKVAERTEAVRALASHLRGRRGVRCPSNLGWLLWRLWKIHEWDDHVAMTDLIDRMDSIGGSIITLATGAKRLKWSNLHGVELSQQ